MRIKDLFTVPQGERVTEKTFGRVLVSSVCSILLCMACLFGTTWAWFVAGIENTGNVIQIANVELEVTTVPEGESSAVTGNSQTLTAGVYDLRIEIRNEAAGNEAGAKHPVYVIMTTCENKSLSAQQTAGCSPLTCLTIHSKKNVILSCLLDLSSQETVNRQACTKLPQLITQLSLEDGTICTRSYASFTWHAYVTLGKG